MTRYVLDASAVVKLFTAAPPALREFWRTLRDEDELLGPRLLIPECASVITVEVTTKAITEQQGIEWIGRILQLPIRIPSNDRQFTRALELANRTRRRKSYDMQYLALAQLEDCEVVTVDAGMRQAAIDIKHPVRFLG